MFLARFITCAVILAGTFGFVFGVDAQTPPPLLPTERQTCTTNNLNVGFRSNFGLGTTCYGGFGDADAGTNGISCDTITHACCANAQFQPQCLERKIGFTAAQPDATLVVPKCPDGWKLDNKTNKCVQSSLTFTPNVPIPGLFEGTKFVDSTLFSRYVSAFFVYFIGVIGVLAVVMMMWGGYHYITATGNAAKMKQGKEIINNSIIGLILALTSYLLLSLINPNLVNFSGIFPSAISTRLQPLEKNARPQKSGTKVVETNFASIAQKVKTAGYQVTVQTEATRVGLPPERLMAILFIESGGNPNAQSPAGAYGLMQLLPTTANKTPQELFDPATNIRAGADELKRLFVKTCPDPSDYAICDVCKNGDWKFINAGYNGGRGANTCSRDCKGQTWWMCQANEGYEETRNYVDKADAAYKWLVEHPIF